MGHFQLLEPFSYNFTSEKRKRKTKKKKNQYWENKKEKEKERFSVRAVSSDFTKISLTSRLVAIFLIDIIKDIGENSGNNPGVGGGGFLRASLFGNSK